MLCERAQYSCTWMEAPSAQSCWCQVVPPVRCPPPGLPGPVGAVLPGQAVPTLSSLLTFLGYSGSCQQAQPAENFAPCAMVASPPVGAFSQTAHSVYTSPCAWPEAEALRGQDLGVSAARHGGHRTFLKGWPGFRFPLRSVGSLLWHKSTGLSHSANSMAPCTTFGRFLQGPALARAICPALSTASGARNPKNTFSLM